MVPQYDNHVEVVGKYQKTDRINRVRNNRLFRLVMDNVFMPMYKPTLPSVKVNFDLDNPNPVMKVENAIPQLLKNFHDRYVYIDEVIHKNSYKRYFDYLKLE